MCEKIASYGMTRGTRFLRQKTGSMGESGISERDRDSDAGFARLRRDLGYDRNTTKEMKE